MFDIDPIIFNEDNIEKDSIIINVLIGGIQLSLFTYIIKKDSLILIISATALGTILSFLDLITFSILPTTF